MKDKLFDNIPRIPDSEFHQRITVFKKKMSESNIDLAVAYSMNYIDPSSVRYLCDYYPVNENAAIIIPLEGDPVLCSGQASHAWSKHTLRDRG
ncbi:MAG: hypothetical protein JSV97_08490 [candidate division WOR-3 bacterium]|nr:MAG: hypothetical protein JSV97_08490 [candidate division WOR-3 bacterium]